MKTFSTALKPTVVGVAISVTGILVASTLAYGQIAVEAGVLAPKNPPASAPKMSRTASGPTVKPVSAPTRTPVTGRVDMAPQINLSEGKSTLMRLPSPASRLSVGDARIADVILLNPSEVYLLGKSVGSTNLILWNKDNDATIMDIAVGLDTAALRSRLELLLAGEKDIKITTAGNTLILSGMVSDVVKADQVISLANVYVQSSVRGGQSSSGQAATPAGGTVSGSQQASVPRVINMLSIAAPQQVMLEVKVAEVSKTLVDELGASIGLGVNRGAWTYSLLSNLLTGSPSAVGGVRSNGNFATLDAQKRDGLVKVLAEPTIMAISGQEASFLPAFSPSPPRTFPLRLCQALLPNRAKMKDSDSGCAR